ncbi:DUF4271 domain-containing protein [Sphingobacterium sp. LRF_L2]|uniref:DUF4271 domain-containing protein n=1 Tax=Sphingobacterium sp. LRF_L2 TaxID=3369421 RepID=UPI003F61C18C
MYLLKSILLICVFCYCSLLGFGQVDTSRSALEIDSVQRAERDDFNYVFPSAARPHQLLDQLMLELMEQSTNFQKAFESMQAKAASEDTWMGQAKVERPSWVLLCVFILFLAIALIRLSFPGDFAMIVEAYFNERTLQQVSKEDNMLTSWPYVFLYLIFSLALGLFILVAQSAFVQFDVLNWKNYFQTTLFVSFLFILKILLIRFISFVFEIGRLVREYVTVLYLVYFNSMLFLMPFLLGVTLVPTKYFNFLLILFSVVVSILFIYRFLRTAFRLFGNLKFSVFYLILYLCALEVAPILILVKTLSN